MSASTSPVHPRAGGERIRPDPHVLLITGSSPRGRGTRRDHLLNVGPSRFIPARAGNAQEFDDRAEAWAVHPRAGGERGFGVARSVVRSGSSPRGRGTHDHAALAGHGPRFIPARAGNASAPSSVGRPATVHPRAGGERKAGRAGARLRAGSSPRGRGTRVAGRVWRGVERFIPARAGNALANSRWPFGRAVHPRAGGERSMIFTKLPAFAGSSPRGRGTHRGA